MEIVSTAILIACIFGIFYVPFSTFNRDMKKLTGTSTFTNALLYRKLVDENKLTRLKIKALERQARS